MCKIRCMCVTNICWKHLFTSSPVLSCQSAEWAAVAACLPARQPQEASWEKGMSILQVGRRVVYSLLHWLFSQHRGKGHCVGLCCPTWGLWLVAKLATGLTPAPLLPCPGTPSHPSQNPCNAREVFTIGCHLRAARSWQYHIAGGKTLLPALHMPYSMFYNTSVGGGTTQYCPRWGVQNWALNEEGYP